jgi:hypothetical protein
MLAAKNGAPERKRGSGSGCDARRLSTGRSIRASRTCGRQMAGAIQADAAPSAISPCGNGGRGSVELQPFGEEWSVDAGWEEGNGAEFPDSGPGWPSPTGCHRQAGFFAKRRPKRRGSPANGRGSVAGCVQTPFRLGTLRNLLLDQTAHVRSEANGLVPAVIAEGHHAAVNGNVLTSDE